MSRRTSAAVFVGTVAVTWLYFSFAAQPASFFVGDALATGLGLRVGPGLAAMWAALEAIFVLLPFAAVAIVTKGARSDSSGLWLAPLLAYWGPVPVMAIFGLVTVGSVGVFSGVSGTLVTPLALAADIAGTAAGAVIVVLAARRTRRPGPVPMIGGRG